MAYVASIHKASSVRHACKLENFGREGITVALAKANRIELYSLNSDGTLSLYHSESINGKIILLDSYETSITSQTSSVAAGKSTAPLPKRDHLFIATDLNYYFTISWNPVSRSFHTEVAFQDLTDGQPWNLAPTPRMSVDPGKRFILLEVFEGILSLIPIAKPPKGLKKHGHFTTTWTESVPEVVYNIRIPDLWTRSSTWLFPTKDTGSNNAMLGVPRLAMLTEDTTKKVTLKVRVLDWFTEKDVNPHFDDLEKSFGKDGVVDLEGSSTFLIPAGKPAFGLLVVTETKIVYLDGEYGDNSRRGKVETMLPAATIFVAWEHVDGLRWLLADDYGYLYFVMLVLDKDGRYVDDIQLQRLGKTSTATCLVYLEQGVFFVGSHSGDSQVIRIVEGEFEILQSFDNLAPILDFTIMDLGARSDSANMVGASEFSSGQARIVAGCGAWQDGSLRSVRSGVPLEDLGTLGDLGPISALFDIHSTQLGDVLVVSDAGSTRFFRFEEDGEIEELESFLSFDMSATTIFAGSVGEDIAIQITEQQINIFDSRDPQNSRTYAPNARITSGLLAGDSAIIACGNDLLASVNLSNTSEVRTATGEPGHEISCLYVAVDAPNILFVGLWNEAKVQMLDLETLQVKFSFQVGEGLGAVPRSIAVGHILDDVSNTLVIACADGNVVTFQIDLNTGNLTNRKSTILGTREAKLTPLVREGQRINVFAANENPSLIHGEDGRMIFSAITAEKASCICPFPCKAFPGAVAIVTPDELKLVEVGTSRTTHIQTLPLGQLVRRIAYSSYYKVFGMGTVQRKLLSGIETVQSHFKLADEIRFEELDSYALEEEEIIESVMNAKILEDEDELRERFVVGTAFMSPNEEDIRGKLLVFQVTPEKKLSLVTEHLVKGSVRALGCVQGRIVAALTRTVVIFHFENGQLVKNATHRTSTTPIDLSIRGDQIAIADLMKSVSIIKFEAGSSGHKDKIVELGRRFKVDWSTSAQFVDENTVLLADADGNLTLLNRDENAMTDDQKRRLESIAEISLGEAVNKIRTLPASPVDEIASPRAFLATTDGSVFLFALISSSYQDMLMRLQTVLEETLVTPGLIPFKKYRSFRNAGRANEEPFRFVDGDWTERFLDLKKDKQEKVVEMVQKLGSVDNKDWSVEEVVGVLEKLRRMH